MITEKTVDTYTLKIKMAGDIGQARMLVNKFARLTGICVTLDPTLYIYTGGEETGFVVGFINYPRFATAPDLLWDAAKKMAELLLREMNQLSCLIEGPTTTLWMTQREQKEQQYG